MKCRTLATIGLPVRLEIVLKSHLNLVNARTTERWAFSDELDVDVVICNPDSTLSALTAKRSRESGSRLCISLVRSNQLPLDGTVTLHARLHVGELIELLNKVSAGVKIKPDVPPGLDQASASQSAGEHVGQLARTLHDLMKAGSRDLHLIEAGMFRFCLLPVSRSAFLHEPLTDSWLSRMLAIDQEAKASIIPLAKQQQVLAGFQHRSSLLKLLWHAGLHCKDLVQHPIVSESAPISLNRWPDFGILKYEPAHLRMSAELSRNQLTLDQLAQVTKTTKDQARAFVNACALCNLIESDSAAYWPGVSPRVRGKPEGVTSAAVAPRRSLGFLNSIRSALGLGAT